MTDYFIQAFIYLHCRGDYRGSSRQAVWTWVGVRLFGFWRGHRSMLGWWVQDRIRFSTSRSLAS